MRIADLVGNILEKYPNKQQLSKARLNKIIYLIDWKYMLEYGKQLTDIEWIYNHYGPYVSDIENEIDKDPRLGITKTHNIYGNEKNIVMISEENPVTFEKPNNDEEEIINFIIDKTKKFYWNEFIQLVYSTYPIISQEKGSKLNMKELAEEYKKIKEK
ncbi:Panacea domain-containing protein [Francisellaceae bacterium CB299]